MPPTNSYNDEALARALQIEYEREYRRRSMQQHLDVPDNHASSRASTTHRAPASTTQLPPPPIPIPSAPLSNSFYEEEEEEGNFDGNSERMNNHAVGAHRGAAPAAAFPSSSFIMAEDRFGNVEMSDQEYARQLEREMVEEERRRSQRKQHLQQQRDSYRAASMNRGSNTVNRVPEFPPEQYLQSSNAHTSPPSHRRDSSQRPTPTVTNIVIDNRSPVTNHRSNDRSSNMSGYPAVTGAAMLFADEELAMRMEQEMRDEELARQAFVEEQIRQSSIAAQSMQNSTPRQQRAQRSSGRSCGCRMFQCILMLAIAGAGALLLLFFVFNPDQVSDFIPNPDQFKEEDPFNSANTADANLWRTKGNAGLELVVVNALDDIWHPYFFTAVDQWEEGQPDTLSLTVEVGSPDSTCTAIDGKLKVCNGNYGATNWRGINKILLENGWIYSSAARMNEFYVTDNDGSQRQYTMCHEIGHGFGLPHTDENFYNKDLGNCMDYTNNPDANMQPALANFKFLAVLYGTVDGSSVPTDDNVTVESAANNTAASVEEDNENWKDKFKNIGGNRRRLLPHNVAKALSEIDSIVDNGFYRSEMHGWRILHESAFGHAYEVDLGEGYSVQVHALNA